MIPPAASLPRPALCSLLLAIGLPALAQPLGEPDRDAPGDAMIQEYLRLETQRMSQRLDDDLRSREAWESRRPAYLDEYRHMLGLDPWPDRTPLHATVTGVLDGDGYHVEKIHYQSRPGLYVTGNLYRPAAARPGERLPAVFYVCGHSGRGRNGNKVAYQSHGIWFARHGYVCLVVDSLQLGEIASFHHGTYNLNRWWWLARGYTPAGVEAWNGVRGIDYLVSRPDVDPSRIAVTGISGGGAATFWIAALDERVTVAVPVSGMADLESYIPNRVINGHCDCMFLHNTFAWPWTRIAALVAPRPMLFVNSDQDPIFPMDANERVLNRLERLYGLFGAGDRLDAVVSVGGHAYRQDIRQAAYRFINTWLKSDPAGITDSERDIVSEGSRPGPYPIPPEDLRVFPTDADLPGDERNTRIDETFVPLGSAPIAEAGAHPAWKTALLERIRRWSFGYFPETVPAAQRLSAEAGEDRMTSENGIEFRLRARAPRGGPGEGVLLVVLGDQEAGSDPEWLRRLDPGPRRVVFCEPRGIGATRWTRKNPPNYVERSHVLLGRTVDAGRVWDVIAAAKHLRPTAADIHVAGRGPAAVIAAYAAALDDAIAGAVLVSPILTHMETQAPQFLNILRIGDVPDVLGLIAPRPLRLIGVDPDLLERTSAAYDAAGAIEGLRID